MEAQIIFQGKNDPAQLDVTKFQQPIENLSDITTMAFMVVQEGMVSGEPSVLIITEHRHGTNVIQTSLDKFLMGAQTMASGAEEHWGWKRPEGSFTLMPMEPAARKMLLEKIKEELEGYEDLDGA